MTDCSSAAGDITLLSNLIHSKETLEIFQEASHDDIGNLKRLTVVKKLYRRAMDMLFRRNLRGRLCVPPFQSLLTLFPSGPSATWM